MSEKKVGKRLLTWVLVLVMTLSLLPLNVLADEGGEAAHDVVQGYYDENGVWTKGTDTSVTLPNGVDSVSKTAVPATDAKGKIIPNQYDVTLKVELEQTTSTTPPGAAATALVLDCSGSMKYCMQDAHTHDSTCYEQIKTECTKENNQKHWKKNLISGQYSHRDRFPCVNEDGKYYFYKQGDLICTKTEGHVHNDKCGANGNSRMDAAKKASIDFLKVYSGFAATDFNENGSLKSSAADKSLSRYVAVIRFSDALDNDPSWVDVSTVNGYTQAFEAIVNARAEGGTNLDAGLRKASDLMEVSPIAGISAKNVIALTDGEPTFYQYYHVNEGFWDYDTGWYTGGQGNYCDEYTYNTTKDSATTLKSKSVELYTVCFSAVGEKMKKDWGWNGWYYWDTTVDQYLATEIATDANHAKTAKTADELNTVFAAITDTIISGLNSGTVTDRLPAGVTFKNGIPDGFTSENGAYKWELSGATGTGENGKTVYTYTTTYTVTIDPETAAADEDGYVPLNGKTTLTVDNGSVDFPIPAGKVTSNTMTLTATSYTGKYDGGAHGGEITNSDGATLTYQTKDKDGDWTTATSTVPTLTNVGKIDVKVTAEKKGYETESAEYTIEVTKRDVTLTSATDSKVYDGTPLTNGTVSIGGDGFVDGEGATYDVTGTATNVSTEPAKNIFEYTLNPGTNAANYNIAMVEGTLTITPKQVTIKVNDAEKVFGDDDPAFTGTVPPDLINAGDLGEITYVRTNKDVEAVGTYPDVLDAQYTNNTNYDVIVEKGDFEIKTATSGALLTAQGGEWTYDGNPHTATASVSGADGYTIYYKVGGADWTTDAPSVTDVNNGLVTVSVKAIKAGYADLTCTDVTLKIKPRAVTITVDDKSKMVGENDPEFTGTAPGLVKENDLGTITYVRTNFDETVGDYPDVLSAQYTENSNYTVTVVTGDFTITEKQPTTKYADVEVRYYKDSVTDVNDGNFLTKIVMRNQVVGNQIDLGFPLIDANQPYGYKPGVQVDGTHTVIEGENVINILYTKLGTIQLGDFIYKNFESRYGASTEETFYAYAMVTPINKTSAESAESEQVEQSEQSGEPEQSGELKQSAPSSETPAPEQSGKPEQSGPSSETPASEQQPVIEVSESLTLDDGPYEYEGSVTLKAGYSKQFTFAEISLPAGKYYVEVYERDDGNDNVVYDDTTYFFTLTVNEDGSYSASDFVSCAEDSDEWIPMDRAEKVEFTNVYTYRRPHHPRPKPTVEIEDDDALGLNTTDHFAYIVGYGNGEVRPQNNITRAEVATIFFRLLTDDVRDENLTKTNRYSDVAATSWYNTAVSTLSSMGIITGYPDGTFRPNAAITRAEFAAIAARFDNDGDKTTAKFSDIATHWAKDEISIAYNNGWINGYPNGTFGPQRDITRAETMTLVNRVLNRQPETENDLLPNMVTWTDNADKNAWYYLAVQEATNSHYYKFKTNSKYEKWTELRETRDWTQLEK